MGMEKLSSGKSVIVQLQVGVWSLVVTRQECDVESRIYDLVCFTSSTL